MKSILTIVFLSCTLLGFSQRRANQNLKGFDENKKIHFGFLLGLNYLGSNLSVNNAIYTTDTIYSVNVKPSAGFNLGVITDIHLGHQWDFRTLFPTLIFGQRDFEYVIQSIKVYLRISAKLNLLTLPFLLNLNTNQSVTATGELTLLVELSLVTIWFLKKTQIRILLL